MVLMVFSQFLLEGEDVLNDVPFTFEVSAAMSDLNDFCFGSHFGITNWRRFMFPTFWTHQDLISKVLAVTMPSGKVTCNRRLLSHVQQ